MTPQQQEQRTELHQSPRVAFGDVLKATRLDKGIGLRKLAAITGISHRKLRELECGRSEVRVEALEKIVVVLNSL
jgi:transcriptional regulator with XRE-family HTH domain